VVPPAASAWVDFFLSEIIQHQMSSWRFLSLRTAGCHVTQHWEWRCRSSDFKPVSLNWMWSWREFDLQRMFSLTCEKLIVIKWKCSHGRRKRRTWAEQLVNHLAVHMWFNSSTVKASRENDFMVITWYQKVEMLLCVTEQRGHKNSNKYS
jgi:hypothetical protein